MHRKLASPPSVSIPPVAGHCRKRSQRTMPGFPHAAPLPRPEPRLLCSDLLTVRLDEPGAREREIPGILEEIAAHSASLQFEEPIAVGTGVRFLSTESSEGGNLTGVVVECLHQPRLGYFAEVRFSAGCTWSPKNYRPLHLFDPAELLAVAWATAAGS